MKLLISRFLTLVIVVTVALGACSMAPDYKKPSSKVPEDWVYGASYEEAFIDVLWWENFESETLNGFIEKALVKNRNLRASLERIKQSRALLRQSGASLFPSLDTSGNMSRRFTNPSFGSSSQTSSWSAGINASYELDLFGQNRSEISSSRSSFRNSEYENIALALVIASDVARSYFNILNIQERINIAATNITLAEDVLLVIEKRVEVGRSSQLELERQKGSLENQKAGLLSLQEQLSKVENTLSVLLGEPPQSFSLFALNTADITLPDIKPFKPEELLIRRPDILAAEQLLIGAHADIGAARAAFFPDVTLALGSNISALGFGDPTATLNTLALAFAAPIFSGGALDAGLEVAEARQRELLELYQQSVLTALREVEDSFISINTAYQREKILAQALESAQEAYRITRARFQAGSIDYETVLESQTTQLNAQDSYATAQLSRLNAALDLYKALGGGWKIE